MYIVNKNENYIYRNLEFLYGRHKKFLLFSKAVTFVFR